MGYDQNKSVSGILLQNVHHVKCVLVVQRCGGFVGENDLRIIHHGSCDGHTLALSAGQLGGALAELALGEAQLLQKFLCAIHGLTAVVGGGNHDIVQGIHVGNQIMLLENEAELLSAKLLPLGIPAGSHLGSVIDHASFRGLFQSGNAVHERALAASGGTDDPHQPGVGKREVETAQSIHLLICI